MFLKILSGCSVGEESRQSRAGVRRAVGSHVVRDDGTGGRVSGGRWGEMATFGQYVIGIVARADETLDVSEDKGI